MKAILLGLMMMMGLAAGAQITAISPVQAYRGDSLQTAITSSGLFLTGSSPQGNIQNIILKNATDSVFAISDSTNVVNTNTATTFWKIPSSIATGLYTLIVRVYNSLFSGPTTDYTLNNSFNITTPVWPGDVDNNGVVDNNDLLHIGLAYGSSSTARLNTSVVWQAQSSVDWANYFTSFLSALNYKYADCNGDGTINAADTAAIMQNFSLTHAKTSDYEPWRSGRPALIPVFSTDTLYNGDTLKVSFVLGDSSIPAAHIYGLSFTYNFDPQVVDSSFINVNLGNSWLGSSTDMISISKVFAGPGQIRIAMTRIDHSTRSGSGPIGNAGIKITTDNISGVILAHYGNIGYISAVTVVDSTGDTIPVNAGRDSSTVVAFPAHIPQIAERSVHVQPNPASNTVSISAENAISEISISDINGQKIWHSSSMHSRSQNIDISTYADGLYFVQVRTERGVRTVKLLVAR
jgi:hypothetical protein